jgi:hypothetical protein
VLSFGYHGCVPFATSGFGEQSIYRGQPNGTVRRSCRGLADGAAAFQMARGVIGPDATHPDRDGGLFTV